MSRVDTSQNNVRPVHRPAEVLDGVRGTHPRAPHRDECTEADEDALMDALKVRLAGDTFVW